MRKLVLSFMMLFGGFICLFAQQKVLMSDLTIDGVFVKNYHSVSAEQPFKLIEVTKNSKGKSGKQIYLSLEVENSEITVSLSLDEMYHVRLNPHDVDSYWKAQFLRYGMVKHFEKKGFNYPLRNDLLEESINYLSELQNNHLLYEDILVENYVQKIFSTIVPRNLHTSLPEIKGISILKSPAPDVYMLPGGILMITTGLLSVLDSEEELVAIMASELSHYVLDHHMINIRANAGKIQRAEIWSAILSGFAIAADEYLAYKNEYYLPGTFSLSADIISVGIFNTINKHLGMDFSLDQKKRGDRLAKGVLQHNNMNPLAINSALTKIHNYYLERKDFYPLSKAGQHYQLDQRIGQIEEVVEFYDPDYKWSVAGVNVYNAITQLYSKDYSAARYFINKNIESNLAIDEDYIILAKTNLGLYNNQEANEESLRLIEEAIQMAGTPNLNAYKQRIIALMRMDGKAEIRKAINEYADLLKAYETQGYTVNEADWILSEFTWIEKLRTGYF